MHFNEFRDMKMKLNKKIIFAVIIFAFFIQTVIITYNHFSGFIHIDNAVNLIVRLFVGTTFSSVFGLLLVYIDIVFINYLDKILPLHGRLIPRIPAEILLSTVSGIFVGSLITVTAHILMPYPEGLIKNVINNSLITSVINIILILAVEAVLWFKRGQDSLIKAEKLEKENTLIRFETLKNQLNPHFMFNSMNVLSSLIKKDADKAQNFVDEFSSVYRYTLDVIERRVVELREELEFAKSYLYLQKIRFDNAVITEIKVDASKLDKLLPPLSVQTLLENAFKHNKASAENPLSIKIFNEGEFLFVVNNLQPKIRQYDSKGIGLNNLKKRYELLGTGVPCFSVNEKEYVAKIPFIAYEE